MVDVEVVVARPRDQVFDLMADTRNEAVWNSHMGRAELITEEPIGAGTEFTTTNRGQEYVAIITAYDRPQHLVFDVVGRLMEINASMDFAETAEGTRLTGRFDLRPKGIARLTLPLMAGAGPT